MWDIERRDHVAVVTMNSNNANVQNPEFFADLHRAFDRLDGEFGDCAVVLTGRGSCFSAGIDFDYSFPLFASRDEQAIRRWFEDYRETNLRIFRHPTPTVAAINGHAFAGGLITALNCDFRVAGDGPIKFSLNEVLIGIPMPAVYVEIIRHAVGITNAAAMCLQGSIYDTRQAAQLGIVHKLAPPEQLIEHAVNMARRVDPDSFAAYAFTKKSLQARTWHAIATHADKLDRDLSAVMSDLGGLCANARRYREIKGRDPSWEIGPKAEDQEK